MSFSSYVVCYVFVGSQIIWFSRGRHISSQCSSHLLQFLQFLIRIVVYSAIVVLVSSLFLLMLSKIILVFWVDVVSFISVVFHMAVVYLVRYFVASRLLSLGTCVSYAPTGPWSRSALMLSIFAGFGLNVIISLDVVFLFSVVFTLNAIACPYNFFFPKCYIELYFLRLEVEF